MMEQAAGLDRSEYLPQTQDFGESAVDGLGVIVDAIENAEPFVPPPEPPEGSRGERANDPGIVPLGHAEGSYFFISVDGEKREFKARDLVRLNIASLFGGDTSWLCRMFPCYNKKGEPIDDAFHANNAAEWLMRSCSMRGLFNKETPLRGLGVWRHKDEIVAHLGSHVWYRGQKQKSGCVIGGAIYPARTKLEEPDFEHPADSFECRRLRAYMNAWTFIQDFDADLLFGFLGAGLLGGFPAWRVHALVTGERGSGKSTLGEFLMNAFGAQGTSMNDYTEAGLRQTLTNEGRTPHLDEGESSGEEKAHRMAKVIGLLRLMSGGSGARIARGSSGGTAMNSTVTGCVLLTAINPPPLQPQDRSRILIVPIEKHHNSSPVDIKAFLDEARDISPRLRARALMGAKRFVETVALYRDLMVSHGCDSRQADLYATLCAGRSLLIHDEVPSREEAMDYVNALQHRLRLIMLEDSDSSDAQSCLNRLLDASCEAIRDGIKRSIGMLVASGMDPRETPENDKLVPLGLRIIDAKGVDGSKERYLFVANDHLGLKKIFFNTPWADGNWRTSLIRLAGVRPSPKPVSIGRKARGLLIPHELLPAPDTGNLQDFSPIVPDPAPPEVQT